MFVIQIGASDGKYDYHRTIDEVWTGITQLGWTGVLIEPNPRHFIQLQQTYRDYLNKIKLLNCAINIYDGNTTFYDCVIDGNSSLKEEIVLKNSINYKPITVDCKTINTLLWMTGIPDYLVIDAEGSDGDILEDLDFIKYPIKKIRFEFSHLDMKQLGRVCLKLIKLDYILSHDKADIVAEKM
jgi:FkbM family methyltransferase